MTTNYLSRPKTVKTFAANAMDANHLAVRFGTNRLAKDVESIANDNFEYGIESLEGDLQPRDLNSVLKYLSANLTYLFQQGVAEFSPYQDYPFGALAQYDGSLWITTTEVKASKHEFKVDQCNPCAVPNCEVAAFPSKDNGWCRLVTFCEYSTDIEALKEADKALSESIANLKGVAGFSILPNKETGLLELSLQTSDGKSIDIPMTKFGHIEKNKDGTLSITNADSTTLELPKFVAEKDLDQQKGFYFNTKSGKWEVDLADLVQNGSGLQVDKNGNISIKPLDLVDGTSLSINAQSGKMEINPDYLKTQLRKPLDEIELNGAKVFTKNPIKGNGKKDSPLGLNISEDFTIDALGNLALNAVAPQTFGNTSLKETKFKLGFHTFTGEINSVTKQGTLGLPLNIESNDHEQNMSTVWDDFTTPQQYDYNGYYIASGNELNVWLANNTASWYISNENGVNPDGTLKNPNSWTKWQKLDNAGSITNEMIKKMQEQINAFAASNTALNASNNELKTKLNELLELLNKLKNKSFKNIDSNYTVLETDDVIISTATNPINVNFPVFPTGKEITIIQAGVGEVTLLNDGNSHFIKPRNGSYKLSGIDASVQVLYELGGWVRIFGDTKNESFSPSTPTISPVPIPNTPPKADIVEWVTKRYNIPCAEVTYEVKKVNGIETEETRNTKHITNEEYVKKTRLTAVNFSNSRARIETVRKWLVDGVQVCEEVISSREEIISNAELNS